jgi:FkbM family methyltransferase
MKLKLILPENIYKMLIYVYNRYFASFVSISYSQEGEDLIIQRIIGEKKCGFYVDVGAHHPKRFSNTYLFYKKGWTGINIEPMPGSKKIFDRMRYRDTNIEAAISDSVEKLNYFMFTEPALNTFLEQKKNSLIDNNKNNLINKIELETITLESILDKYLPHNIQIDFLSIDTEGYDFKVLKSNNWDKYIPKIILLEDKDFTLELPENSEIYNYLIHKGYKLIAMTFKTLIFNMEK